MEDVKNCSTCKLEKSLLEFYTINKTKADGTPYIYYRPDCKDCTKEQAKLWMKNNPDKYKASKKKYDIKRESKELRKPRDIEYRNSGRGLEWQRSNKDKIKKYNENRKNNKKHEINKKEWLDCRNYFDNSCAYCGLPSDKHLRLWYGEIRLIDLHKDHVNHVGSNDLSNCVPACQPCNSSKQAELIEDWYTNENKNFTKERLNKIHKWLNEDHVKYIVKK